MLRNKRAQSTLEYVVVLTAIIAAIIVAATKFIKPRVEGSLDYSAKQMEEQVKKINFSK